MNEILSLDCHLSTCKVKKAAPGTIVMFDLVKLTTSTKVSPLQLVTTGVVLWHLKAKKWLSTVPLMESKCTPNLKSLPIGLIDAI